MSAISGGAACKTVRSSGRLDAASCLTIALTAAARSPRVMRSPGWKVWLANGSMIEARPTCVIHGAAQCPCASVITTSRAGASRTTSSRRTPISAARSPRVICGTSAINLNSGGSRASRRPRGHCRHPRRKVGSGLDLGGAAISVPGALEVAARLQQLPGLNERHGVGAVEFDSAPETVERRVRIALFALEQAELTVKKRAVRRRLQRSLIRLSGLGQPPRGRRRTGGLDHVL